MGKLTGILPIEGTVGNVTFMKTIDGIIARPKGGISAQKIASDPRFQRTRENAAEFGRAGKAAKILLTALRPAIQRAMDQRVISRLVKSMMQVIKTDTTNARGDRNVQDGSLTLIKGFECNKKAALGASFYAPYTTTIDRVTGELEVMVPPYVPTDSVKVPEGATHFRIIAAAVEVNFGTEVALLNKQISGYVPFDNVATTALTLTCTLTPNSTDRLILALGIEYYQQINAQQYPLNNGAFNAFALVDLDV